MADTENKGFSKKVRRMFGLDLDSWNKIMVLFLGIAAFAAIIIVVSQAAVIKLQKQSEADTKKEYDLYKLDAGQKISAANAIGETAKAEAAKANERAEQLRADNISLQAGVRPRRLSFMGWTTNPERVAKIYEGLKPYAGTSVFIQVVPDFEAQMFAKDIASVLATNGWNVGFVTEKETRMPALSFSEGVFIFTLSDGKSQTEAGTALWTAMVGASHEMGAQPFEGAPIHEILDGPKPGYPQFDPPITAVFVRVGLRQLSSQFLEIQRRELARQDNDWNEKMKEIVRSGRTLMSQATDGSTVAVKIGPDGKLVSADPSKTLLVADTTPTLIFRTGLC
jgi:hypothetical protein